jgi:hypothetical protein
MKKIKNFLVGLLFYVPFGAHAIAPLLVGALIILGAGLVTTIGTSVYRTIAPLNMNESLQFFSSCWSCHVFSGLLSSLSMFIPKIYTAIGNSIIPIAVGLTFVWFAWKILEDYIKLKPVSDAWEISGTFGTHMIKMVIFIFLLSFPLPRFMMDTFIEPIMNVGMSYNHSIRNYIDPNDLTFDTCVIATTLRNQDFSDDDLYSSKLRNNITCQIAEFHKMTGLGMTVGFTIEQMAFDSRYAYVTLFGTGVTLLPNLAYLGFGLIVLISFIWALVPIPLYFMEVFTRMSLNILMLPFMLIEWLFNQWGIFPKGTEISIKTIITDAVKDTFGIALTGVFLGFAILFLNSLFGDMKGLPALMTSIQNNDPTIIMEALKFKDNSFIELILMGIFIGMFMNAIPNLIKILFKASNPQIDQFKDGIKAIGTNTFNFVKDSVQIIRGAASKSKS